MFLQSGQCLVPAELELGRSTELPPSTPRPAEYMKAGRKENLGTSWNRNRRQNKGKTQKPGRGTSEDRFSWLLPANNKSQSWRKNKSFLEGSMRG